MSDIDRPGDRPVVEIGIPFDEDHFLGAGLEDFDETVFELIGGGVFVVDLPMFVLVDDDDDGTVVSGGGGELGGGG